MFVMDMIVRVGGKWWLVGGIGGSGGRVCWQGCALGAEWQAVSRRGRLGGGKTNRWNGVIRNETESEGERSKFKCSGMDQR